MSRESQISPLLWTEYIVFWMCGGRRRRRGLRDSAAVDAWRVASLIRTASPIKLRWAAHQREHGFTENDRPGRPAPARRVGGAAVAGAGRRRGGDGLRLRHLRRRRRPERLRGQGRGHVGQGGGPLRGDGHHGPAERAAGRDLGPRPRVQAQGLRARHEPPGAPGLPPRRRGAGEEVRAARGGEPARLRRRGPRVLRPRHPAPGRRHGLLRARRGAQRGRRSGAPAAHERRAARADEPEAARERARNTARPQAAARRPSRT